MINIPDFIFNFSLVIIIIYYLLFIVKGAKVGFITTTINLVSTFFSLFISVFFSKQLAKSYNLIPSDTVNSSLITGLFNQIVWGLIIFIFIRVLLIFLKILLNKIVDLPVLKQVNKSLGALFGFVHATIILLLITMALQTPIFSNGNEFVEKSSLSILSNTSQNFIKFFLDDDGFNIEIDIK